MFSSSSFDFYIYDSFSKSSIALHSNFRNLKETIFEDYEKFLLFLCY